MAGADGQTGVGELGAAAIGVGPLHPEVHAVTIRYLDDDGLHQHLGTTNVELGDDLLQLGHHVRLGGDHQGIGGLVGGDGELAAADAGAARGRGSRPALLVGGDAGADPLEDVHQILALPYFR
jgi:hypothetical protein